MARMDAAKTWRKVEERLGRETDPRRRQLLENVLAHTFANLRKLAADELPSALVGS